MEIQFQTLKSPRGRVLAIIAQAPDAVAPQFVAAHNSPLIYQSELELNIRDVFGNEEGRSLAEELETTPTTIWRIRKALGIARTYTGESRITRWRRRKSLSA